LAGMDTNLGGDFKCGMIVSRIYICTLSKKNRVTPPSEHRDYKWKKVHHKPVKNDFDTITRFGFLNNKSILITGLDRFLPSHGQECLARLGSFRQLSVSNLMDDSKIIC
jgi:hypothetical protein